jgi:phosphoglycerate kinase
MYLPIGSIFSSLSPQQSKDFFCRQLPLVIITMSTKKSIADLSSDLKGKKILVRCDLNVPLDGKTITDDTRIRSSIPTIEYLTKAGAIVTVCSHLGRPKQGPEDKFSLGPCG